jgi:hypothetical protein
MAGTVLTWQLAVKLALLTFFVLRSGHFDAYLEPIMRPVQQFLSNNLNRQAVSQLSRHVSSSVASSVSSLTEKDEDLVRRQALALLRQKRQVLETVSDAHYTEKIPSIFNSSVASHLRHILDHYQTAIAAAQQPTANPLAHYDERERDTAVEKSKDAALAVIERMEQEILGIDLQKPIRVAFYGDTDRFEAFQLPSVVGREVAFASHHAIHHLSMVKLIMQDLKYSFPADATIGIAPSTAKDLRSKGAL